ncbi:GPALPP motifs-containing protein 1 [Planococcus citri]|uniref:GPALPP motifs-containing protein 1 n=1 Tax=Planococcus citri TaxID=170843 RepID=UPI0031F72567
MGHHKKKKKHKSKHRRRSSSDSDSANERSKKQKVIGPCMPTVLQPSKAPDPSTSSEPRPSSSSHSDSYGPQLPPNLTGPQLPPHLTSSQPSTDVSGPQPPSDFTGPQLPPQLVGPQLPPHLSKAKVADTRPRAAQKEDDDDDVGDIIGPLPGNVQSSSSVQQALDERAEILKYEFLLKGTGDEDITARETWMTELPPEKANYFGLGPRKFRATNKTGDPKNRALWTETPLDKNKSQQEEPVDDTNAFEELVVEQRNKIMDQIVKKTEEKKDKKSLLEIHREKLKKKKQESKDGKGERRPFDRDVDLEVNKFDEAQKKSMLKKSQLLDSRFAHSKSKYL